MKYKYVIEMDLIPIVMTGRKYNTTRRFLIEAESMCAALLLVEKEYAPGQDCIGVRVLEIQGE